jgi:hypothetical protein
MVIAIIAGLEIFSVSNDWRLRSVCNSAIAQIIMENQVKVVHEDQLTSIWNLYFALGSISTSSPIFPDRVIILKALRTTSVLYGRVDWELSSNVVNTLMRINNKVKMINIDSRRNCNY